MGWLIHLADKRAQRDRDQRSVRAAAAEFWASLQDQLRSARDTYTRLYPPNVVHIQVQYVRTGKYHAVVKRMTLDRAHAYRVEKDNVAVQFHPPATITALYSTHLPPVIFHVTRATDGPALIEHNKEIVSLEHACELILRPILFDDLPTNV